MLGDIASGVGLVKGDHIAHRLELGGGEPRELAIARGAVAVAKDEIRPAAPLVGHGVGGHGVAVDEHGEPEFRFRLLKKRAQCLVIGRVQPIDALERRPHGERLAINLVGLRNDAGNGAEPSHHPHRLRVGVMGEAIVEERRIELVGLAVDVEISAREMGIEQRRTHLGNEAEQLLHIGVLGAP